MKRHIDCKFFDSRAYCPHYKDQLMEKFRHDIAVPQCGSPVTLDFSKSDEVDTRFCSSCTKFEPKSKRGSGTMP
jgi:hypothetical protein